MYPQFEALWTGTRVFYPLWFRFHRNVQAGNRSSYLWSLTVSFKLSTHLFTMLLIVPVVIGILNTPERISWVRLMLTAPTVFRATADAWRVFTILYGCFYVRRESIPAGIPVQHTDWKFQCLMLCYMNCNNRINYMAFFCNTGGAFTHRIVRASFAWGWHMSDDSIWGCYYCQMCSLVSLLSTDLFAGWFTETLGSRFFIAITWRWFGTVFGVLIKLLLQFLNRLI